jgi:hypothetical protein
MQTPAKWLRSAAITALLAVLALFVSPAFAIGCCCGGPAGHAALASPGTDGDSCCDDDAGQVKAAPEHAATHCATVTKVCDCAAASADQPFVFSDNTHFPHFVPAIAPVPRPGVFLAPIEDVRLAPYVCHAARPRSPSSPAAAGRAPPALALS